MTQDRWTTVYKEIAQGRNLEPRPQQAELANAIFEAIDTKRNLLGEARTGVGKSFAYLVPAIKATDHSQRTVVSTETIALQDQLVKQDLPFLSTIFPNFTYCALKGRTWYLCKNRAQGLTQQGLYRQIRDLNFTTGEREDVESRIGRRLSDDDWEGLCGSPTYCAENKCTADRCYSTKARGIAGQSDIIVTNHSLLRTDGDMENGLLGDIDNVIVDEAHTLRQVLVDGWTESVSAKDIDEAQSAIIEGVATAGSYVSRELATLSSEAMDDLIKSLDYIQEFFRLTAPATNSEWKQQSFTIKDYTFSWADPEMHEAIIKYEVEVPKLLERASAILENTSEDLNEVIERVPSGARKVAKAANRARDMHRACEILKEAITTKDGFVTKYGIPFVVIARGYNQWDQRSRTREDKLAIDCIPLDVSQRCRDTIFQNKTVILLSATLTDPTDGTFNYAADSLGVGVHRTLQVDSPFSYATQQLVYVTPAEKEVEDLPGAQFSIDELTELIHAASGRTLVLFTANTELERAAQMLRADPTFHYPLYVQERGITKQELVDKFTSETHSVLLASKSFFTGVNFSGETCSLVVICKFPLPQFNALCKAQITYWRKKGYPKWYERESLLVFQQAAGRLIRSESDHGVVALLDQRVTKQGERVRDTAVLGGRQLGSNVTRNVADVKMWLDNGSRRV